MSRGYIKFRVDQIEKIILTRILIFNNKSYDIKNVCVNIKATQNTDTFAVS